MSSKPKHHIFFWFILPAILVACGKQTVLLPTETPIPTFAVPTLLSAPTVAILTETLVPNIVTPSPYPTEPTYPLIMPDAFQVRQWDAYEDAIATASFSSYLSPEEVVCEWIIMGQTAQEVYVWANCASVYSAGPSQSSLPTVIHIGVDGSIQNAERPTSGGADYASDIRRMFPPDVQEMIFSRSLFSQGYWEQMMDRLRWRRGHPDEPPWIILMASSIQPTQPVIPIITPGPIQVKQWKEYQTVLAKKLSYLPSEQVICEWEILGQLGNEVYVWAVCGAFRHSVGSEDLVRVIIDDDGSAIDAMRSNDHRLYPSNVLERYYGGEIHFQDLVDHLRWRLDHPEEPPLIILNATEVQ